VVRVVPCNDRSVTWEAAAVGDSCVFHLRGSHLHMAFPVADAAQFGSTPQLVGSTSSTIPEPVRTSGTAAPGDVLLCATDALAEWLLSQHQHTPHVPFEGVCTLRSDTFSGFVDRARASFGMENDDVAMIRCRVVE